MMNPIPSIPMLSGSNGSLFLGVGILVALVLMAKKAPSSGSGSTAPSA
jgi:hypothetical protein